MKEWIEYILLYNPDAPIIFTGLYFWGFFAVVLAMFSVIYKRLAWRNAFLFLVSLFFYYKTSGLFFLLLVFSITCDYLLGFRIAKAETPITKKLWLILSITLNLSLLVYFKYAYFFTDSFNNLFGSIFHPINHFAALSNNFFATTFKVDKIILPIGISFYTFQTMSYAIDIFRNRIAPVKSFLDFGFYVSFFPQLVAGPIVRAADFIPQLYKEYQLTKHQFGIALFWILNGLIKKIFLADYIAINLVDRVFSNPVSYTGFENLLALYAYSLQVYADFSGYTDIAIGVAMLMGFHLNKNFNSPYKADSVADFWKRWHISLSSWLKDYLYISIGGNKKGTWFTYIALIAIAGFIVLASDNVLVRYATVNVLGIILACSVLFPAFQKELSTNLNMMLTMLVGGLWHGASWNFVIWGGLNGAGLLFYKLWKRIVKKTGENLWWRKLIAIIITFHFITFTRIWFRTGSKNTWGELNETHNILTEFFAANDMLRQLTYNLNFNVAWDVIMGYKMVCLFLLGGFIIHWLPESAKEKYRNLFASSGMAVQLLATLIVIVGVYQVLSMGMNPFIYFQF